MATRDASFIPDYHRTSLEGLLDDLSSGGPLPGGGSAAAVAASVAASLTAKVAHRSHRYRDDVARLAADAAEARDRLASLISVDAESYARVLEARRRGRDVAAATIAAGGPPAAIAEQGATVAHLAAELVEAGDPNLRVDAMTALRLAVAATEAAADLAVGDDPGRSADRAGTAVTTARNAAERVSPAPA